MYDVLSLDKDCPILRRLSVSDDRLGMLINQIGSYTLHLRTDYFTSLTRAIIGQQLSIIAARTIWHRTISICGEVTPQTVLSSSYESLRYAGLSQAKITYIKALADKVVRGIINFNELINLPNKQVIDALTNLKGVGKWTAEMFLIFSLGRLDVLSVEDAGLRRAIRWLYSLEDIPSADTIKYYGQSWVPYRTVASLYLWEAVNRDLLKVKVS